jgi:hypothetical protein
MGAGSNIMYIRTTTVAAPILLVAMLLHLIGSTGGAHADPVMITVVSMVVNDGHLPFDYRRSGAVVDMAVNHITEALGPGVNVTHIYYDYGSDCTANHVGALASEVYTTRDVSVFIGPGKLSPLGSVSKL